MTNKSRLGPKFLRYWGKDDPKQITQEMLPVVFLKLKINSLTEVDVASSTFKADFILMVDWHDPSIRAHDPSDKFDPSEHFCPVVVIDNLADELEEDYNVQIRPDEKSGIKGYVKFTKRYIKTLTTPISCEEFPFDKQVLQFEFKAQGIEGNSKIFVQFKDTYLNCRAVAGRDSVRLNDKIRTFQMRSPRRDYYHSTVQGADRLAEWQFHSLVGFPDIVVHDVHDDTREPYFPSDVTDYDVDSAETQSGAEDIIFSAEDDEEEESKGLLISHKHNPNEKPGNVEITEKYIVQLRVARDPRAGFLNVLFPITLTGVMSFATYAIALDSFGDRCGAILTLLLTLVAFKFSLENKLPQVPYLTTLDIYLLATMIMFTVQLIGQAITSGILANDSHDTAATVDLVVGCVTGAFWIGLQTYVMRQMVQAMRSLPNADSYFITSKDRLYKSMSPHNITSAEKAEVRVRMYSPTLDRAREDIAAKERYTKDVLEARCEQLQGGSKDDIFVKQLSRRRLQPPSTQQPVELHNAEPETKQSDAMLLGSNDALSDGDTAADPALTP